MTLPNFLGAKTEEKRKITTVHNIQRCSLFGKEVVEEYYLYLYLYILSCAVDYEVIPTATLPRGRLFDGYSCFY